MIHYVDFVRRRSQTPSAWLKNQILQAANLQDTPTSLKRLAHLARFYSSGDAFFAYGCRLMLSNQPKLAADAFTDARLNGYLESACDQGIKLANEMKGFKL